MRGNGTCQAKCVWRSRHRPNFDAVTKKRLLDADMTHHFESRSCIGKADMHADDFPLCVPTNNAGSRSQPQPIWREDYVQSCAIAYLSSLRCRTRILAMMDIPIAAQSGVSRLSYTENPISTAWGKQRRAEREIMSSHRPNHALLTFRTSAAAEAVPRTTRRVVLRNAGPFVPCHEVALKQLGCISSRGIVQKRNARIFLLSGE